MRRRYPPPAVDYEAFSNIVRIWVEDQNLRWSENDMRDVLGYFDLNHYQYSR